MNKPTRTLLVVDNTAFAKWNSVRKSSGKQVAFLTEHTVFFIRRGKKRIHLTSEIITAEEGQLILLKKGIYTISEIIPLNNAFEAFMIFIPESIIDYYRQRLMDEDVQEQRACIRLPSNKLLEAFQFQYQCYQGKSFQGLKEILTHKVHELVLLLLAAHQQSVAAFVHACGTQRPANLEFIMKQFLFQPLSLSELAYLSSRSLAAFKRDFYAEFGTSVKRWILRERLRHAKILLRTSSKTVSEVAGDCCFESTSHFIRAFKKEFGSTPGIARAKKAIH